MIGTQRTGALPGVVIQATSHEGLLVDVNGKRARIAIVDDEGNIIAMGPEVAREVEAVALNNYRNALQGKGFLRTYTQLSKI